MLPWWRLDPRCSPTRALSPAARAKGACDLRASRNLDRSSGAVESRRMVYLTRRSAYPKRRSATSPHRGHMSPVTVQSADSTSVLVQLYVRIAVPNDERSHGTAATSKIVPTAVAFFAKSGPSPPWPLIGAAHRGVAHVQPLVVHASCEQERWERAVPRRGIRSVPSSHHTKAGRCK